VSSDPHTQQLRADDLIRYGQYVTMLFLYSEASEMKIRSEDLK